MMNEKLLTEELPPDAETWLRYAGENENFDPRLARVALFGLLLPDFDPSRIDIRYYDSDMLTLFGLRRFRPQAKLLKDMETLALAVRGKILAEPGVNSIDTNALRDELTITRWDMQKAIRGLQALFGSFFSGLRTSRDSNYIESVEFFGPSSYDFPLKFTNLDVALEREFFKRQFVSIAPEKTPRTTKARPITRKAITTNAGNSGDKDMKDNTAFVIMPIDPSRPELEDVLDTIKSVAASFGISAYRADELEHQDVITNVVLDHIRTCQYLIADLSLERPNVYYEIGYAHALGKQPILYRRTGTRLHFDLSVHNVPEYGNARELRELLTKRLRALTKAQPLS